MTQQTPSVELKPCPFCGGPAGTKVWRGGGPGAHEVDCQEQCTTWPTTFGDTPEQAAERWNTRATIPTAPLEAVQQDAKTGAEPLYHAKYGSVFKRPVSIQCKETSKTSTQMGFRICEMLFEPGNAPLVAALMNAGEAAPALQAECERLEARNKMLVEALEEARRDIIGISINAFDNLEELGVDTTEGAQDSTGAIKNIVTALKEDKG